MVRLCVEGDVKFLEGDGKIVLNQVNDIKRPTLMRNRTCYLTIESRIGYSQRG